jgi:muconate cycloisomerase
MKLSFHPFVVHKRVPLTISRGTQSASQGWEVRILHDGIEGIGESSEFSLPGFEQSAAMIQADLEQAVPIVRSLSPWQRTECELVLRSAALGSASVNGIDMALYDWMGKATAQPVWRLLGLSPAGRAPLSVTIGISSPQSAQQRWVNWLEWGRIRAVKIKMGCQEGIADDQARFEAVRKLIPPATRIGVDANGGWSARDAIAMCQWLAERDVDHVEQPTAPGDWDALRSVHYGSPIPVLVDEACRTSRDIPALSGICSGINIKLPKCGGISEALRMIATARAHGLKVMLGCYSNTSLANSAANQIAPLVDYVDLDSHLNLNDDPFVGCRFDDGYLHNRELHGLGVTHA